ncbi:response regulator [Microvirga soli]|uniref:response regulator n=1 Tax=Microvirga soli TaxID=1854496 RepID=UPI001920319F|nr:response regulator [Microvirga soli]
MLGLFGKRSQDVGYRTINDIEASISVKRAQKGKLHLRKVVPIVVIDDQPFEPGNNLQNHGYQITHVRDVKTLAEIERYPVILCDLQGVGTQLSEENQGAHLIREIKTHYPDKVVIAYTGIAKNKTMTRVAQQSADYFLKKDADIDQWLTALDQAVDKVTDPVRVWKEFRKRMLDAGLTPLQLAKLESAYVAGLEVDGDKARENLVSAASGLSLTQDLRGVIQGFVASLIFKALVG